MAPEVIQFVGHPTHRQPRAVERVNLAQRLTLLLVWDQRPPIRSERAAVRNVAGTMAPRLDDRERRLRTMAK